MIWCGRANNPGMRPNTPKVEANKVATVPTLRLKQNHAIAAISKPPLIMTMAESR